KDGTQALAFFNTVNGMQGFKGKVELHFTSHDCRHNGFTGKVLCTVGTDQQDKYKISATPG
ncbi:MAG: hypothetical protein WC861_07185, partial [Candidatus Micrarchaeia archaeon]